MMLRVRGFFMAGIVVLMAGCTGSGSNNDQNLQHLSYPERMANERQQKDSTFLKPEKSPLPTLTAIDTFNGLNYFPVDTNYRVKAVFEKTSNPEPFRMAATGEQQDIYEKYGELHFTLHDTTLSLSLYQNLRLKKEEDYQDYLFIPFKDATNGQTTYGGGRYLDFTIPQEDTVVLDLNEAYNPYCAYSYEYSCPIPPEENHLPVAIRAGEKDF